jgi:hypothetical protein
MVFPGDLAHIISNPPAVQEKRFFSTRKLLFEIHKNGCFAVITAIAHRQKWPRKTARNSSLFSLV